MQQIIVMARAEKNGRVLKGKEGQLYGRLYLVLTEYNRDTDEDIVSRFRIHIDGATAGDIVKVREGDFVMVEGRPETDAYLDSNGEAKADLVIFANRWKILK